MFFEFFNKSLPIKRYCYGKWLNFFILQDAHHLIVDDCEIIVDYNRQQLMPGWIPRRLGQLKWLILEVAFLSN